MEGAKKKNVFFCCRVDVFGQKNVGCLQNWRLIICSNDLNVFFELFSLFPMLLYSNDVVSLCFNSGCTACTVPSGSLLLAARVAHRPLSDISSNRPWSQPASRATTGHLGNVQCLEKVVARV